MAKQPDNVVLQILKNIQATLAEHSKRFDRIDQRFERLERRLEAICRDLRIKRLEAKV